MPIQKFIWNVHIETNSTPKSSVFFTAAQPGTILGILWNLHTRQAFEISGHTLLSWALHVQESSSSDLQLSTPGVTGAPYNAVNVGDVRAVISSGIMVQEEELLHIDTQTHVTDGHDKGSTQSKRKMKVGDSFRIATRADAILTVHLAGQVTLWYKTA